RPVQREELLDLVERILALCVKVAGMQNLAILLALIANSAKKYVPRRIVDGDDLGELPFRPLTVIVGLLLKSAGRDPLRRGKGRQLQPNDGKQHGNDQGGES